MTGQDIFDLAIKILDEQNESTGSTDTIDTKTYKLRSVALINHICQHCYSLSDTYFAEDGKRGVFPKISTLSDAVNLDDHLATVVVPMYLAADLIRAEDDELYPILKAEADDLWKVAKQICAASEFEEIEDLYGINDMGDC